MATKPALASKVMSLLSKMINTPCTARPKHSSLCPGPLARPLARPTSQELPLPPPVMEIIRGSGKYQKLKDKEVPDVISGNIIWRTIAPLSKDVYVLCADEHVTAVLVKLHDTGALFVIKAWPAARAGAYQSQVDSELEAAKRIAWHPLVGTLVAFAEQDHKGEQHRSFCSIAPYSGCCLYDVVNHPGWFKIVSDDDRLKFARLLVTQSLMVYDIMQRTEDGYLYRDVKPANIRVNPVTGLASTIDYGLMVQANLEDFHAGATIGYHTPEMVNPEDRFASFYQIEKLIAATNSTMDVFLAGYTALEVAVGLTDLPWRLNPDEYDTSGEEFETAVLQAHADAAAAGYIVIYGALLERVTCPQARAFFAEVLCVDPAARPSPAEALQHPWLAESRQAVEQAIAAAAPAHLQLNQLIVKLFEGLRQVILPQKLQQDCDVPAGPVSASNSDNPYQSSLCSSPDAYCGPSARSSSSSHDAAARDQLSSAGGAAVHKQRPGLLQRGKKLLAKLSRGSNMNTGSGKKQTSTAIGDLKMATSTAAAAAAGKIHAYVGQETCTVSVPGFCGLTWFRRFKAAS